MDPFVNPNRAEFQLFVFVLLALFAWSRGGAPERYSTSILLGMLVVDRVYHAIFGATPTFASLDVWHFTLDFTTFLGVGAVAIFANRLYPLWLAALQLVAVLAHLVRGFVEPVSPIAYYVMFVMPSYLQIVVLALGVWAHRRRLNRFGEYRDWRSTAAVG